MLRHWWKILATILVLYVVGYGLIIEVPDLPRMHESIRNLFYHVPMWFTMLLLLLISVVYSIKYLRSRDPIHDTISIECINVAILFGLLGFVTGAIWGMYAWGAISQFLIREPKSLASIIGILIYLGYVILRGSIVEEQNRAKVSAVFNIFAFVLFNVFIIVIPRLTDSLHPGSGGNPGFSIYDSDNTMKAVFYPAVVGWILLGLWIMNMRVRIKKISMKLDQP